MHRRTIKQEFVFGRLKKYVVSKTKFSWTHKKLLSWFVKVKSLYANLVQCIVVTFMLHSLDKIEYEATEIFSYVISTSRESVQNCQSSITLINGSDIVVSIELFVLVCMNHYSTKNEKPRIVLLLKALKSHVLVVKCKDSLMLILYISSIAQLKYLATHLTVNFFSALSQVWYLCHISVSSSFLLE